MTKESHEKTHQTGDKAKQANAQNSGKDRSLSDSDRKTIIAETAAISDRDKFYGEDRKTIPGDKVTAFGDSWAGDDEETVKGDRRFDKDAFEELETLHSKPAAQSLRAQQENSIEDPFPAEKDPGDDLGDDSLKTLKNKAEALGIPGLSTMNRRQLIEAIRTAAQTH